MGSAVPPPARDNDRFEMNSKVLGSFLESDGGFDRECTHRIMRGGTVWAKFKKRTDFSKIHVKTKGRLFKASLVASLLYGTEVRGISEKHIQRMQTQRKVVLWAHGGLT